MNEAPVIVYQLHNAAGELLYVGATRNVIARMAAHQRGKEWWPEVDVSRTVMTSYERAWGASEAERELVVHSKPRYNQAGVPGKGHVPYPATRPDGEIPDRLKRVHEAVVAWRAVHENKSNPLKDAVLRAVANGASVRKLADFTGLSTNTISRWKRGE